MNRTDGAAALIPNRYDCWICELGDDLVEIRLAGEIDGSHASGLREHLEWALERDANVLLDLRRCEFLDSAALAAVVFASRALTARGQRLAACGGGAQIQRLFDVTGLGDLLFVGEDRGAAIRAASGVPTVGDSLSDS